MGLKGRIKFTVAGQHPLLDLARNHLIHQGLALVPWDETPDFALVGAEIGKGVHPPVMDLELLASKCMDVPVVLLSSSSVYSDRNWSEKCTQPFEENRAMVWVPSPGHPLASRALYSLMAESIFMGSRNARTLIIRPFNLYGPEINWGVIHTFIGCARRGEALPVHGSGYQTRTFLYQEDFFEALDRLVHKFVKSNLSGVYNIGSAEEISITRLADSIWQITHGAGAETHVEKTHAPHPYSVWKVPCINRIKKVTGWRPKSTLRTGLFRMIPRS